MIQIIFFIAWTGFNHPESVAETDDGIYVSDVGEFSMKDGVIWKVSGNSKEAVVKNLTDPKGMVVARGKIYVADVDRIWRLEKGGAVSLIVGPNAFPTEPKFLNGMATDATGYLYVSDTFGGWVYRLSTLGKVEPLFKVDKPNGLVVASDGTVYAITFTNPGRIYAYRDGKAELVKFLQDNRALMSGLGICYFARPISIELYAEFLSAISGKEYDRKSLLLIGERIYNAERLFNIRAGLKRSDDTLPRRLFTEPSPTGPIAGKVVPLDLFEQMLEEYYRLRAWNRDG
ncbi:MAG: aldehyde ferredoxin oxidoreductase C-terminal domain-containing protein, partial [candidate division WOR-3 bacterium]